VASALGPIALDIVHIGSTSVPGLAAKPIVDVDVVVAAATDISRVVGTLSKVGYVYEGEKGVDGRHAFEQPRDLPPHHLYVCASDNPELKRHIAFRDFLRGNPEEASAYATLKKDLADRFGSDREGYTNAKSAFIAEVLSRLSRESR